MKIFNFRSFQELRKSGWLERLIALYCEVFTEWGETHDSRYVEKRLEDELSLGRPYVSLLIDGEEVIGVTWGAVIPTLCLKERLLAQRPNPDAPANFSDAILSELAQALEMAGVRANVQVWDEILLREDYRGRGLEQLANLVRFGARQALFVPVLMWTDPKKSRLHKIVKRVWKARVIYKTGEIEFLLISPTWRHRLGLWLRLDSFLGRKNVGRPALAKS